MTAVPKPPCSKDTAAARLFDKLLRTGFVRVAGSPPANQLPFLPNQRWYFRQDAAPSQYQHAIVAPWRKYHRTVTLCRGR